MSENQLILQHMWHAPEEVNDLVGETNTALRDWAFDVLRSAGYEPYDVSEDGWTSYGHEKVRFKLKGVWHGWSFGLWLYGDRILDDTDEKECCLTMFCQHDLLIDKFKPSCSPLVEKVAKLELQNALKYDLNRKMVTNSLIWLVDTVKWHPFLVYDEVVGIRKRVNYAIAPRVAKDIVEETIHDRSADVELFAMKKYATYKLAKALQLPDVRSCRLDVWGLRSYPNIVAHIRLVDNPSDRAIEEIGNIITAGEHKFGQITLRVEITFEEDGEEMELA